MLAAWRAGALSGSLLSESLTSVCLGTATASTLHPASKLISAHCGTHATPRRLDQLRALGEQLELCQKALSDYLDTKRAAFPRVYFISDDELLAVLGTSDPASVQEHMLKLFDNAAGALRGHVPNAVFAALCPAAARLSAAD